MVTPLVAATVQATGRRQVWAAMQKEGRSPDGTDGDSVVCPKLSVASDGILQGEQAWEGIGSWLEDCRQTPEITAQPCLLPQPASLRPHPQYSSPKAQGAETPQGSKGAPYFSVIRAVLDKTKVPILKVSGNGKAPDGRKSPLSPTLTLTPPICLNTGAFGEQISGSL